jgi:hypothetical protein
LLASRSNASCRASPKCYRYREASSSIGVRPATTVGILTKPINASRPSSYRSCSARAWAERARGGICQRERNYSRDFAKTSENRSAPPTSRRAPRNTPYLARDNPLVGGQARAAMLSDSDNGRLRTEERLRDDIRKGLRHRSYRRALLFGFTPGQRQASLSARDPGRRRPPGSLRERTGGTGGHCPSRARQTRTRRRTAASSDGNRHSRYRENHRRKYLPRWRWSVSDLAWEAVRSLPPRRWSSERGSALARLERNHQELKGSLIPQALPAHDCRRLKDGARLQRGSSRSRRTVGQGASTWRISGARTPACWA